MLSSSSSDDDDRDDDAINASPTEEASPDVPIYDAPDCPDDSDPLENPLVIHEPDELPIDDVTMGSNTLTFLEPAFMAGTSIEFAVTEDAAAYLEEMSSREVAANIEIK